MKGKLQMTKKETFFVEGDFSFEKLEKCYPEIFSDIPRVCAIAGCSYLDCLLNDLLKLRLVEDKHLFDKKIERLTFEKRIDLCFLTGIIRKEMHTDLIIIKEIRNKFAHEIKINNFDSEDIPQKCSAIKINEAF